MIHIVIGRRELGKTTLAYYMARRAPRRAIIDARRMIRQPSAEYEHDALLAGEAVNAMVVENESTEVIYQPFEDDLDQAFSQWCRDLKTVAMNNPDKELAIMVDEASFYNLNTPAFQWLAKCSLRDYTHIIVTAHRPADIPTSIRSIADHWFIFYTSQQHDLKAIEEKSPEAAREARLLKGRDFVHWDDARARLSVNRSSMSWFVQLQSSRKPSTADIAPEGLPVTRPLLED